MASGLDLTLNSDAMRDILRSDGVRDDLARRAERVRAHAGPGMAAEAEIGKERARASVWTDTFEARVAEARDRTLTRSIDAARG